MLKKTLISASLSLMALLSPELMANAKDYRIGTLMNPADAIPVLQHSGDSNLLRRMLAPPILAVQRDGRVRCLLCKDVPEVEIRKTDAGNIPVVSIELKADLHWGDGTDILARDIKHTLETMALADYPKGEQPVLPIKRIELDRSNKRRLTLILNARRSDAFQLFAISLLPFSKAAEWKQLLNRDARAIELYSQASYAYGPYRIASREGETWLLESNRKANWDNRPDERLSVRFHPQLDALRASLESKLIDQTDELNWAQYQTLKATSLTLPQQYEALAKPSDRMQVLAINTHSPLLVNPQLRQALYYGVNRQSLSETQFEGLAETSEGLLSPGFAQRMKEERPKAEQPKLAEQILEQNAWLKGEDGIRSLEGRRLNLILSCPAERLSRTWMDRLALDMRKLGIELTIETPTEAEYLKKTLSQRRFRDLACVSWTIPPLSIPNNIFHSLAIPDRDNHYLGANYSSWDQNVVDRLLDNMLRETDRYHFSKQFARLEKQFLNDTPGIPLVYVPDIILRQKAGGLTPSEELSQLLPSIPTTEVKL